MRACTRTRQLRVLLLILGIICLSVFAAPAAVASSGPSATPTAVPRIITTPPVSTPYQQVDDLIQPSLVFLSIAVTGTVDVAWSDGSIRHEQVGSSYHAGVFCSGTVITDSGVILTAGHCLDPGYVATALIYALYAYFQDQGEIPPSGLSESDAKSTWVVEANTVQLTPTVYPMANVATVGEATPLPATVLYDEPIGVGDDIALLQVGLPPGITLPALQVAQAAVPDGAAVVSAGFPGSAFGASSANLQTLVPFNGAGVTEGPVINNGGPYTTVSSTVSEGMSGGPTVNMAAQIIGTNSRILSSGDGDEPISAITEGGHILVVLASHHILNQPSPADMAWRSGLADYWKGWYREAVRQFQSVLTVWPHNVQARDFLAQARKSEPLEHLPKPKPRPVRRPVRRHADDTGWVVALIVFALLILVGSIVWLRVVGPRMRPGVRLDVSEPKDAPPSTV
jgi:serine protease Do